MQRILACTFAFALLLAITPGSPVLAARPSDACLAQINELTGSTRTETVPVTDHDVAESSSVSHGDTKAIEVSRIDEVRGYLDTRHCNRVKPQELVMVAGSWVYIDDVEGKRIRATINSPAYRANDPVFRMSNIVPAGEHDVPRVAPTLQSAGQAAVEAYEASRGAGTLAERREAMLDDLMEITPPEDLDDESDYAAQYTGISTEHFQQVQNAHGGTDEEVFEALRAHVMEQITGCTPAAVAYDTTNGGYCADLRSNRPGN